MSKYQLKHRVVVEIITFEELVAHGRAQVTTQNDELPWSFNYAGIPITHESDECYLIPPHDDSGVMLRFTPDDMLMTGVTGILSVMGKAVFEGFYEKLPEDGE